MSGTNKSIPRQIPNTTCYVKNTCEYFVYCIVEIYNKKLEWQCFHIDNPTSKQMTKASLRASTCQ